MDYPIFVSMTDFQLFFTEGFEHITDLNGIDHILFVAALTSSYLISDWRKLLMLVTAFTIGHSITLALSSLNILTLNRDVTEFLIALTILITSGYNISQVSKKRTAELNGEIPPAENMRVIYLTSMLFGLIHGLGFSSYLKSLFGKDENVMLQLLSFNLGLEAGQLIIVAVLLFISFIFVRLLKLKLIHYIRLINLLVFLISFQMCIQRFPF